MIGSSNGIAVLSEPRMRFFQKPGPKYQLSSWSGTHAAPTFKLLIYTQLYSQLIRSFYESEGKRRLFRIP
jgi:hypothetical protein